MTSEMLEYEASDEASENEMLDKSLSIWRGRCVEAEESFTPTPLDLHTAASIGQYECVHSIISLGDIDLNKKNKGGWSALMYACYIGHDNIVNLLLDAGVCVNERNDQGCTPLMLAASCGNESVVYFLLQQGAGLECRDNRDWTALFHAVYSGHQNMVKFLLDNDANPDAVERCQGYTPFMIAAAEGHEIIVQYFLQHGADCSVRSYNGDTARSLALMNGYTKVVSLIDTSAVTMRTEPNKAAHSIKDFSSSDENYPKARFTNTRHIRTRNKTSLSSPNVRDGPEAFNKFFTEPRDSSLDGGDNGPCLPSKFNDAEDEDSAFLQTGAVTIKSNSGGLAAAFGINHDENSSLFTFSTPQNQVVEPLNFSPESPKFSYPQCSPGLSYPLNNLLKNINLNDDKSPGWEDQNGVLKRPKDLASLLDNLQLSKYFRIFEEQDVDLPIFLTLTDTDLKEVGIKLFGPRRKMTSAIARWHGNAPLASHALEQAYCDRLESAMQEMAIHLHEANCQIDMLKAQVLQEQKLRSVAESCLLEDRQAWNQAAYSLNDVFSLCQDLSSGVNAVRNNYNKLDNLLKESVNNIRHGAPKQSVLDLRHQTNSYIQVVQKVSSELNHSMEHILKILFSRD